ncbi:hypothetical protein C8Q80DRAFT_1137596 [Daedaleopsis nitida]|nr:hypothetical protein C8Q80DRAFT_1137596 [Daedaleopsis nitida]
MTSSPVHSVELYPLLVDADVTFLLACAATALVIHEHLITIGPEAKMWQRSISGISILFILTRYLTLVDRILVVISLSGIRTNTVCSTVTWLVTVTTSALVVVMAAIAALRVYALWDRDIPLSILVFIAGVFPAIANIFLRSVSWVYIIPTDLYSCQTAPTAMSDSAYTALIVATRAVSILSDGLVVVLTWLKTYRVYVLTRKMDLRANYSVLLLRDGTLYFLAVCILNFIAIVYKMHVGANLMNDMVVTLSSLLMSRFLLNLRAQRDDGEESTTSSSERSTSIVRFAPDLVISMGASVGLDEGEEDHDEDAGDNRNMAAKKFVAIAHPSSQDVWSVPTRMDNQQRFMKGILVLGEKEAIWV